MKKKKEKSNEAFAVVIAVGVFIGIFLGLAGVPMLTIVVLSFVVCFVIGWIYTKK